MKFATAVIFAGIPGLLAETWHVDFNYRAVVQVRNLNEQDLDQATVFLNFPLKTLIKTGKINPDATDIALVDISGKKVPVKICKGQEVKDKIWFDVSLVPAKKRSVFYLYYGNPTSVNAQIVNTEPSNKNPDGIIVSAGAEEGREKIEKNIPQKLEDWLKKHNPEQFNGKVWVRFKIEEPDDYKYCVVIDSEINPYTPARFATGTVSKYGLQPKMWTSTNDWGKPIAWHSPVDDSDWLVAGEYSCWVELPVSSAAQWFTCFIIFPKIPATQQPLLHLEFATEPCDDYIFYTVDEKSDRVTYNWWTRNVADGIIAVRMPTKGGLEGLKELGSFSQYSMKRLDMINKMNLTEPPFLKKLVIGTWVQLIPYRVMGGESSYERADTEFKILSSIGINAITTSGIKDNIFSQLCEKYGIIDTTITGWAEHWRYTQEGYSKKYDYLEGETSSQRWERVFDDYYSKMAVRLLETMPYTIKIAKHFNTGDEIGPVTNDSEIKNTPQLLDEFRQYLKKQKLTPQMLGKESWDQVYPETDRKKLEDGKIEYARMFYHTKKFINDYTVLFYKHATNAIKKHFPTMKLIAPNFQAGPMQFAFIGNNNDMNTSGLDLFELGKSRAFEGIMMEDWVYGWDAGIGRICLGADIMRAASRKWNLPMASYLVGGEAIKTKLFAYLMAGIKENQLYLYGPIGNIGPAWADSEKALADVADITRKLKKFENDIYEAKVRKGKIAQLIAFTSDIMQVKGLYFCPERQNVYTLLKHCNYDVDIVSEQDITQDDILQNYSVLVITDPNISRNTQEKIAHWVSKGGKLISILGAGNWNEYNQQCNTLNNVFGIKQAKMVTQDDWLKWSSAFYSTAVSKFAYKEMGNLVITDYAGNETKITVWGTRIECVPVTSKVLFRYDDGKPAIFYNRYGKGEAILIGTLLGESYVRQHWNQSLKPEQQKLEDGASERLLMDMLLEKLKVDKTINLSVPGIYTQVMDFSEGILVFLNNASGKPVEKAVLTVTGIKNIKNIDSLNFESINFSRTGNSVSIEISIEDVDIIRIKTQ
ncbi:MAG: beta-galactosidase trimerization domain-containing protein [Candidatus Omnitrophica bacterium]|nr:beta-galactosidase trimerization domain-containing protein [Candidatus Omnitrophota bacterium]